MTRNRPPSYNLKLSREWIRYQFGFRGRYEPALRHATRCLNEIASYEYEFLLVKASTLSCLNRWGDLAHLLKYLLRRYPDDPEVLRELASLFAAHGDWESSWRALRRADTPRSRTLLAERNVLDPFLSQKLECMHARGQTRAAIRSGERLLKKNRRFTMVRGTLTHLKNDTLRIEPWAPRRARYLPVLRSTL